MSSSDLWKVMWSDEAKAKYKKGRGITRKKFREARDYLKVDPIPPYDDQERKNQKYKKYKLIGPLTCCGKLEIEDWRFIYKIRSVEPKEVVMITFGPRGKDFYLGLDDRIQDNGYSTADCNWPSE